MKPGAPPVAFGTEKLENVRLPQVITVEDMTGVSTAWLSVHGMSDALATPNESSAKAKTTKNFFIALPPNRLN